ncbi:hypothetical protein QJS04_geneDACA016997 [Acorus gramineus]|uniref:Zinc-ribbon domain-containing protein n=1 Tax=Acorus gramineus TaxID=55184 RepID=A0AAV9ANE0_ACOGR|nr:hypothetical protein QJS04_geneDACA016997 [Acorus gramineus]
MATGVPKVRLVKCPKCRQILPEQSDVPVYQCAGCNTVLRAKNRGIEADNPPSTIEIQSCESNESEPGCSSTTSNCGSPPHESMESLDRNKGGIVEQLALIALNERIEDRKEETVEDHSKSSTESSHAYDGSISSGGGAPPNKYLHLSKRTFRTSESQNREFAKNDALGSSSINIREQERSKSTSNSMKNRSAYKYVRGNDSNPKDHTEILKKVDELRDQLFRTYGTYSNSQRPRSRGASPQMRFTGQTHACAHCGACAGHLCFHIDPGIHDDGSVQRRPTVIRHVRPISGGAPFVVCFKCDASLQLPMDFLLSRTRRFHRLRCGVCHNVLAFELIHGAGLVPFSGSVVPHFPSEAEDSSSAAGADCYAEAGPLSYSEEYGMSFGKSFSTEESDGRPKAGPPLHLLMGYSTPSQVLRGGCGLGSGTEDEF